jgi:threonine dehydrogenase-like Zn-dependent dehydrogenase
MKATVYHAAHDVRLETVPDPRILQPTDAIVHVTRAAICGSAIAGRIDPSPVLDHALPLSQVAEGYAAMDERRAVKILLNVS